MVDDDDCLKAITMSSSYFFFQCALPRDFLEC